jgi:malate dehydrogenase
MVEAILSDEEKVIPSCVMLNGEYGYSGITIGVPAVIGANGVEKIIELDLDEETKVKFSKSIDSVRESIAILKDGGFFDI